MYPMALQERRRPRDRGQFLSDTRGLGFDDSLRVQLKNHPKPYPSEALNPHNPETTRYNQDLEARRSLAPSEAVSQPAAPRDRTQKPCKVQGFGGPGF